MPRVLVIDDNAALRAALHETIEEAGYLVTATATGHNAVRLHDATPFDLVITDMFMPDMDGVEVIDRLRLRDPNIKIIAISGGGSHNMVEVLSVAKLMGASRSLRKPLDLSDLLNAIEELVGPARP